MPVSFYDRNINKYRWVSLVVVGIIGVLVWWAFPQGAVGVIPSKDTAQTKNTYTLQETSLLPVPVSGVVNATNHVVVRAKTAGEVVNIYANEGAVVEQGQLLAIQNTPIENAQYGLAVAEADFSKVQNDSLISSRNTESINQAQVAFSAHDLALLRQAGNESAVAEATKQLATTLEAAVANLSATADFVGQNRSLFTASGIKLFSQFLTDLYSRQPSYLSGSIQYGVVDTANIINRLEESKASGQYDASEIQALAVLVDVQLGALAELFATGERTVFDNQQVDRESSLYAEYLNKREEIFVVKNSVQTAMVELRSTLTSAGEDALGQAKSVTITEADAKEAVRQAEFAQALARASIAVSDSRMGVVNAQISLGNAVAPFSGTVSRVETEVGEYLQPGSPILTLVGMAGKELVVSVPAIFVDYLQTGQEFVSHDKVVGYVDRFSTVAEKGSVQVVIELIAEDLVIGDSVTGNISLAKEATDVLSLPRAYIHFTSTGAVVNTSTNERISVVIVYDYGETVFARGDLKPGMNILPNISGSF